jgi:hypothetical protein
MGDLIFWNAEGDKSSYKSAAGRFYWKWRQIPMNCLGKFFGHRKPSGIIGKKKEGRKE